MSMKYTARVSGISPEQFSSLKSARAWIRDCYSRGMARGESRRYAIEIETEDGPWPNLVDYGFVMNGRLYASK